MSVVTQTKISVTTATTDILAVNGACVLFELHNAGSVTVYVSFDGTDATTNDMPLAAGAFKSYSGQEAALYRGVTLKGITASGSADVHVKQDTMN